MSKTSLLALVATGALMLSGPAWAQSTTTNTGGQAPMMNSNGAAPNAAMQNGAMQQPMATSPSANGTGALKDSAEAHKQQMMQQPNSGQ